MAGRKRLAAVVVALVCFVAIGVAQAGALSPAREASAVTTLIKSANKHNLKKTMSVFTSTPTIRIGKSVFKGRLAVANWWKTEFQHRLKASLQSKLHVQGGLTKAVISRTTRGGDCSNTCLEAAQWHFGGGKVTSMTLTKLNTPRIKAPRHPTSVPTPPKGTPSPNVTPTIPS